MKTKDISYLNKDFTQFKKNLIEFTKQYFPETYSDFSESSPGMLFIELASYIGDVLSFTADNNLKESFIEHATERKNVYDLSRSLGYNVKNITAANTTLDVFQLVPATGSGENNRPDYTYALSIKENMIVKSSANSSEFRTTDSVDFNYSSSLDPTTVSVYETDNNTNEPIYYLLKKSVNAVSGKVKTQTFNFTSAVPYDKIVLPDSNVIEILSVTESDGDLWYNVPYMAQDTIFEDVLNVVENDPELAQYRSSAPFLLKLRKTAKRFITRLRSDNKLELQFGSGISDRNDEEIVPNPKNILSSLTSVRSGTDINIDPSNFLYTRAYGQAPSNTTLTVTYTVGTGIQDNVPSNVLTEIQTIRYNDDPNSTSGRAMVNFVKNSVATNNPNPATGAKSYESVDEIKMNAMSNFATQNRIVTKEDYIVRTYSMPSKYGSVAKAYIIPDDQLSQDELEDRRIKNPLAMNLYTLGYDSNKKLTTLNNAVKENLKTYLSYYRMVTDAVNIKNAFIINVGLDFEISVRPNYNSNEVLVKCIDALRTYFDIDKWQINQPIVKSEVQNILANVKGVQSVLDIKLTNLTDVNKGYSPNRYDLNSATRNGIIYPSLDPSIFEIKFPNQDIRGRVVSN